MTTTGVRTNPGIDELKRIALDAGADDVGVVPLEAVPEEAEFVRAVMPGARSFVSFVVKMARANIRSPERGLANLEFHQTGHAVDEVGRRVALELQKRGCEALHPSMGFPMEMDRFPGRIWTVSHKPVAEAAGMGKMGIHRNLIHPVFGNFILLGTVITDVEVGEKSASRALDFDPCLGCKLCVAACPVGAVKADGELDFSACYNHNYQEFMGGFTNWVEDIAESRDALDYRRRRPERETVSIWQSLSFGANYKAAY